MTSARTWKIVLGSSLLFVCLCAGCTLAFFEGDTITCRLRNLIIDTGSAQKRFTEYQRIFTSAIQDDELLSEDRSREPIEVIIGELYCGCRRGRTLYIYRAEQSAQKVMDRFANDIHVPGRRVQYAGAERVDYRNELDTTEATIRVRSQSEGIPTVYGVDFTYSEPNLGNCWEAP